MSLRLTILLNSLLLAMICGSVGNAAGWQDCHYRSKLNWHRSNVWPQPWVQADRLATCHIFDLMAQNGWCQQSTLTAFHFDPASQQLTEAGRMKVRQILTQHPENFRTVFVVMGKDEKETVTRLDSVQQSASLMIADGTLPDIRRVAVPPRGWPADEVNAIGRRFQDTIPAPRLPDNIQSTTGG